MKASMGDQASACCDLRRLRTDLADAITTVHRAAALAHINYTALENSRRLTRHFAATYLPRFRADASAIRSVATKDTVGITGAAAGRSNLTDSDPPPAATDQNDALRIAVISIDPSRRKGGEARC